MSTKSRLWLSIFLVILSLLGRSVYVQAQQERLVLAFYYAWFDWDTWAKDLSDKPVQPYLSADPGTIAQHVTQAQQAGIDALVLDWYGPQIENNQTEPNFRILLEQAQAHGMQAAVTVDLGGPFLQNVDAIQAALTTLCDLHTAHPAYLKVNGQPVIFFWRQTNYSVATWQAIRNQVDPDHTMIWIAEGAHLEYLEAFDGLYLYSVAWSNDPASVLFRWGSEVRDWATQHDSVRYWVATVMPGYNDLATGRADAFVQAREDGAYYRATWNGAIQSQADWVVITSFNEWLEGSQIEPSESYGDFYLNLTANLGDVYRSFNVPAPTPTSEVLTPTLEPSPTPTLVVPTATLEPTPEPTSTPLPTETPVPTVTPFIIPTPEPTPTPTFRPTVELPKAATVPPYIGVTPTPTQTLPRRLPVEGSAPKPKSCFSAFFALGILLLWLLKGRHA